MRTTEQAGLVHRANGYNQPQIQLALFEKPFAGTGTALGFVWIPEVLFLARVPRVQPNQPPSFEQHPKCKKSPLTSQRFPFNFRFSTFLTLSKTSKKT